MIDLTKTEYVYCKPLTKEEFSVLYSAGCRDYLYASTMEYINDGEFPVWWKASSHVTPALPVVLERCRLLYLISLEPFEGATKRRVCDCV